MTKDEIINHLKETQRDLQTARNYGEIDASNAIVVYYNENLLKNKDPELKEIKDDFFHLALVLRSICSYSQQGHWKSVMSTQIGWMLSRWS